MVWELGDQDAGEDGGDRGEREFMFVKYYDCCDLKIKKKEALLVCFGLLISNFKRGGTVNCLQKNTQQNHRNFFLIEGQTKLSVGTLLVESLERGLLLRK